MNLVQVTLELPEFLVDAIDIDNDKLEEYVRHTLAVGLYREGKLSLGKAKEVAGLSNKCEMIRLLDSRGVAIRYTADDAQEDLGTLDQFFPARSKDIEKNKRLKKFFGLCGKVELDSDEVEKLRNKSKI